LGYYIRKLYYLYGDEIQLAYEHNLPDELGVGAGKTLALIIEPSAYFHGELGAVGF